MFVYCRFCCRCLTSTLRIIAFTSCLLPASTWAAVVMRLTKRRRWSPGLVYYVHTTLSVNKMIRHKSSLEVNGSAHVLIAVSDPLFSHSLFYKLASLVRHRISLFGKAKQGLIVIHSLIIIIFYKLSPSNFLTYLTSMILLSGSDSATMVSCLHILAHSLDFR